MMQTKRTDAFPHLELPVPFLFGSFLYFELLDSRLLNLLSFQPALLQALDVLVVATEAL